MTLVQFLFSVAKAEAWPVCAVLAAGTAYLVLKERKSKI